MQDYRKKIYDKYASCIKESDLKFNRAEAQQWSRAYKKYLHGWLSGNKNAAILDVACGSGNLLHFLSECQYDNLTGVDISSEQVCISKQVINNVIEADILDFLEEKENKFDTIIALDFIEHLDKEEVLVFLNSSHRALKPEGHIILQTPNGQSPFCSSVFCDDFTHLTCFTPESLKRILKLCGFRNIEARQTGPVIHGLISTVRYCVWSFFSLMIQLWSLVETGQCKNVISSRTFLISASKGL
jgi:2-polyprenyl-3-methyl-5-hydroxy-6-metoxy-1,4-benzoquinol methylase